MFTIKDVAALANVSPSTVSRVLSNSPRISEETKERVRRALEELDYHPNVFARGLVTNTASSIGVFIPPGMREFFVNPFFSEMMSGVSEVAGRAGFDIVLSTSAQDEEDAVDRMIRGRRVDGLILLGSRDNDPVLEKVALYSFPAVLLGRPARDGAISFVNNDNVQAAYEATMHLILLGHEKIGFLGGAFNLIVTIDRLTGFRKALFESGISSSPQMEISSVFLEQGGYQGMMHLLALPTRPTAVLASDDVLAFGAMRAAGELGYQLPDDLAIIGFNDIRLAELANPPLTSVRVHMHELGAAATEMLVGQIHESTLGVQSKIVESELVIRKSCGFQRANQMPPSYQDRVD